MDKKESSPVSSILPVIIMSAAALLIFQFFGNTTPEKKFIPPPDNRGEKTRDFEFEKRGQAASTAITTDSFYVSLSNRGGRIEKIYLRNNEKFTFPETVIANSADEVAKKVQGVEITRDYGADFQPHLYYHIPNSYILSEQFDSPILNHAIFDKNKTEPAGGRTIQALEYSLPLKFKNHKLKLIKYYRFYEKENFFRQVTILLNDEKKTFDLGGALFFRTMGDMGPAPATPAEIASYSRFYIYDNSLKSVTPLEKAGSGGFLGLSCGSRGENDFEVLPEKLEKKAGLRLAGTSSRYFFSYANINPLSGGENARPDGISVKQLAGDGRGSYTLHFNNFKLAESAGKMGTLADQELTSSANFVRRIRELYKRKDILLLDNQVYVGMKTDNGHVFSDPALMKAEFNQDRPDEKANDVIYAREFLTLFGKIKVAILFIMRWLYGIVGNYGWCIIIIATGFKLLTFPLNQIQARSMKKMQSLKPEIDKLNEKYKDDAQERNKRMMALYKDHGVNPAKGCLPMLIQMPIFIALYSAFSDSIELWNSPFVLWMTDLSRPDTIAVLNLFVVKDFHLNILPLIMVISQIGSQIFTTVTADPQQKVMMYMMPVVFLFFFWSMPSGVTLYWTVQNILSIVWQVINNRFVSDDK